MKSGMKIIDIHRHFWRKEYWSPSVAKQFALIASGKKFPNLPVEPLLAKVGDVICDPDGTKIIKEMDWLGTDVAILHHMDWGMGFYNEDAPVSVEEINKRHCDMNKTYPGRVYSLIGVDPRRGIKRCINLLVKGAEEWGAVGLNLNANFGFYYTDAICYPLYQKCIELDVPLDIHVGFQHWPAWSSKWAAQPVPYLDDIAVDFPDLVIIINHTGMDTRASSYLWEECVSIAETKMNIYLELSDWPRRLVRVLDDERELVRKLKIMKDAVGAHRIIYGSDQPAINPKHDNELTKRFIEWLLDLPTNAKKYGADFSKEEVELIMHGNAERIFKRMK